MPKTRMNATIRRNLLSFATRFAHPTDEIAAEERARAKLLPIVSAEIERQWPARDMKVLQKYSAGRGINHVLLKVGDRDLGRGYRFSIPTRHVVGYSCTILLDAKHATLVAEWEKALNALGAERERRIGQYEALIMASTTVEDLLEVWPEAAGHVPDRPNLPALTQESYALIQQDRAEQRETAR